MTTQRLTVSTRSYAVGPDYTLEFGTPASLRAPYGGPSGIFLDVTHVFVIVEADRQPVRRVWQVTTKMYEYRLLDYHHEELLVYHWQPGSDFAGPNHPHVHISASLSAQVDAVARREIELDRLHIATGRVSLEAVVQTLITEFKIAPQRHDWAETLARTETIFRGEETHRP